MTVGIDCDGVLFDYVGYCADTCNRIFGDNIASNKTATDLDYLKCWGCERYESDVEYCLINGGVLAMKVIPGAKQFLLDVNKITNGDWEIITACPASWHTQREDSLWENFGVTPDRIHYSRKKHKFNIDVLVDDLPNNFNDFNGMRLLLDQPWNQDTKGIDCHRSFSYADVLDRINSVYKWNNR